MNITKENNRTILSLTPREVEELVFMIWCADDFWIEFPTERHNAAEVIENKERIATLRKWCKAFRLQSRACLAYVHDFSS